MSAADKVKNAAEKALGKAKESVGDGIDNDELVAEGRSDQAKAEVKETAEDVKDVFKK